MKFKFNRRYTTISIYALGVIVLGYLAISLLSQIGVIVLFFGRVARILMPLLLGIAFAFLLFPIFRMFEKRLLPAVFSKKTIRPKLLRALALALTYIVTFAALAGVMAIFIPGLVYSVGSIWGQLPAYRSALNDWYLNIAEQIQQFSTGYGQDDIFTQLFANVTEASLDATGNLMDRGFEFLNEALASLFIAATTFTTSIFNILFGIAISIYILNDKNRIFTQINKLAVAIFPKRTYLLLHDVTIDINRIFSGYVTGRIIDSVMIGILCAIGMTIMRMPHIALVTVIIAITNFIPILGPFIGAIPSTLIILTTDPMRAIWFVIFIIVVQQIDANFISPKIMGDAIGIPPLMTIISLLLFAGLMGFLGMLIGVPLFAVIYSLLRRFILFLLEKKGYPTASEEYAPDINPLLLEREKLLQDEPPVESKKA